MQSDKRRVQAQALEEILEQERSALLEGDLERLSQMLGTAAAPERSDVPLLSRYRPGQHYALHRDNGLDDLNLAIRAEY